MPRIFYPSVFNPPGQFTTTNNAPQGWDTLAPRTTSGPTRGNTRGPYRQQPDGLSLPPGQFATVVAAPVPSGWKIVFPTTTRQTNDSYLRQIPSGDNSGWLRPPPTPSGPAVPSGRIVPRVPIRLETKGGQGGGQVGSPEKIDPRSVRFSEIVEMILNSLLGNGSIFKTGAGEWKISQIPRQCGWAEAFLGEIFFDTGTNVLSYKDPSDVVHQLY